MDSAAYDRYWAVFEMLARPIVEDVRSALQGHNFTTDEVCQNECDEERGLTLTLRSGERAVHADLLLLDGDENGFGPDPVTGDPQVAIKLQVHDEAGLHLFSAVPRQYCPDLGVSTPGGLMSRISEHIRPGEVASLLLSIAANHLKPLDAVVEPSAAKPKSLDDESAPSPF